MALLNCTKLKTFILCLLVFIFTSLYIFDKYASNEVSNKKIIHDKAKIKIGFFLMGTGKYIKLIEQLAESMEKFFCVKEQHQNVFVNYFIFTDNTSWVPKIENRLRGYSIIYQKKLGWPLDTLMRFKMVLSHSAKLEYSSNYLYWIDADMRFVDFVCEDLLGELVGTQHPHYYRR